MNWLQTGGEKEDCTMGPCASHGKTKQGCIRVTPACPLSNEVASSWDHYSLRSRPDNADILLSQFEESGSPIKKARLSEKFK